MLVFAVYKIEKGIACDAKITGFFGLSQINQEKIA
jgi:hypothetical protein